MNLKPASTSLSTSLALTITILGLALSAPAQTGIILHDFNGGRDGGDPNGALTLDASGNIYGTTYSAGNLSSCDGSGCGVVFELSPTATGGWIETVLHAFAGDYSGSNPHSGVIFDGAGNLYGTTYAGGYAINSCGFSCGVVYKLSPTLSGGWKETVIHAFQGAPSDGAGPIAGVVMDAHGNLYGTTFGGGTEGHGVLFELSPTPSGSWTETILVNFTLANGVYPGQLLIDGAGNLYGSAQGGGVTGHGVVFQMTQSGGTWTENILYNFNAAPDVTTPIALFMDAGGNIYGVGAESGTNAYGGIFKLTPSNTLPWPETVIYSFTDGSDGEYPLGNPVVDSNGNVYATASYGGIGRKGTLIELSPSSVGTEWDEQTVLSFNGANGYTPTYLTLDSAGNVYGVTFSGGTHSDGVVFQVAP